MSFPPMSLPGSASPSAREEDRCREARQVYLFDPDFAPIPLMLPLSRQGQVDVRQRRQAVVTLLGRGLALRRRSTAVARRVARDLLPDSIERVLLQVRRTQRAARVRLLARLLHLLLRDLDSDPDERDAYEELLLTVARFLDRDDDSPFPYDRVPLALFDLPPDAAWHDALWRPGFPGAAPNAPYIVRRNFDLTGVLNTAAALRRRIARGATPVPPQPVGDWAAFFPSREDLGVDALGQPMPLPRGLRVRVLDDDPEFGWQRLGGANPLVLERLWPDRDWAAWPTVDADLAPRFGEALLRAGAQAADIPVSWAAARQAGRLYRVDYGVLAAARPAAGAARGFRVAQGVFYALSPTHPLLPVGIRLHGPDEVLMPGDAGWRAAKLRLQVADLAHHEVLSHLWHSHMALEGITMTVRRCLAPAHPVAALLRPHLQGVMANLMVGRRLLLSEDGMLDQLLPLGRQQWIPLLQAGYRQWQAADMQLPRLLVRRGLDDAARLPLCPLRDDGMPLWTALRRYVAEILAVYYLDDAAVQADPELSAWRHELRSLYGAALPGEAPEAAAARAQGLAFDGRASLAEVVTGIIFTSGPVHAAVNFCQWDTMLFAPNQPSAVYGEQPEAPAEALLPPAAQVANQIEVIQLLAGRQFGRLGDLTLSPGPAEAAAVGAAVARLQTALMTIEAQTVARDAARGTWRYPWLHPSRIPNSANV